MRTISLIRTLNSTVRIKRLNRDWSGHWVRRYLLLPLSIILLLWILRLYYTWLFFNYWRNLIRIFDFLHILSIFNQRFTLSDLLFLVHFPLNLKHLGINIKLILNSWIPTSCFGLCGAIISLLRTFDHATAVSKSTNLTIVMFLLRA